MINVIYTKDFLKSLKKKDKFVQNKARKRIRIFRENPFNVLIDNHKLHGEYDNRRSFNVTGDYRIIFFQVDENTVCFSDIGTHAELYE